MSIINRMLKDLESKSAAGGLAPIYRPASRRMPGWFWLVLLLLPLTVWIWWQPLQQWLHQTSGQGAATDRPVSPSVVVNATTQIAANPPATSVAKIIQPAVTAQASPALLSASSAAAPLQQEQPAGAVAKDAIVAKAQSATKPAIAEEPGGNGDEYVDADNTTEAEGGTDEIGVNEAEHEAESTATEDSLSYTTEPANEMIVEEQKLSAGEIAALERRKYQQAMQRRDSEAAQRALQLVLANDPLDLTSRKQLTALYFGVNKLDAALAVLQQGLVTSPSNAELRLLAARIMQAKGDRRGALSYLQAVSPSADKNLDFYALRAALAQQNGQFKDAVFSYRALTQAEPMTGRWWLGLAISLEQTGENMQAIPAYKRALLDNKLSAASQAFARQRLQLPEH